MKLNLAVGALVVAAVLASGCAGGETAGGPGVAAEAEGLECREFRRPGSRFSDEVCATPEEWAAQERESRDDVNTFSRRASEHGSIPGDSGPSPSGF